MDRMKRFKRYSLRVYNRLAQREEQPKIDTIEFTTQIKTEFKSVTWNIENANKCPLRTAEYLESPIFSTGFTNVTKWCLRLYPKGKNARNSEQMGLFLYKITPSTKITLELMLVEKKRYTVSGQRECFSEKSKVYTESEEIGTNNFTDCGSLCGNLEIVCLMKVSYLDEDEDFIGKLAEPDCVNCSCTMTNDFKEMYDSGKFSDVVLIAGKKRFSAHKAVLAARSAVFSAMFEHEMKENKTNTVTIDDIEPDVIGSILQYIYTGKIDDMNADKAIVVYPVADRYALVQLQEECVRVMLKKLTRNNVCRVAVLADLNSVSKLKDATNYYFRNYYSEIFKKGEWKALVEDYPGLAAEIVVNVVSDLKTDCSSTK